MSKNHLRRYEEGNCFKKLFQPLKWWIWEWRVYFCSMHSWLLGPGNSQNHSILSKKNIINQGKLRHLIQKSGIPYGSIYIYIYITHKNIRIKTSFSPCTFDPERVPIEDSLRVTRWTKEFPRNCALHDISFKNIFAFGASIQPHCQYLLQT